MTLDFFFFFCMKFNFMGARKCLDFSAILVQVSIFITVL